MSGATSDEPAIGERVGAYQLEAVLGQGGMGQVFRGRHHLLGRAVAVKILSPQLAADQEFVSRFFYEARVVNEIRHPNIIDIIDFIELDHPRRRVAYVMELLEGTSLGALLKTRRLSGLQALNACLQLSDALEAVHRLNVVHRDLKPDNVFIVQPLESDLSIIPSVKVIDFGIAKTLNAADSQGHRTSTGAVLGTPAYMAPEQIDGADVGPAADIYALGEILYEMVSGARLFSGSNTAVFAAKVAGPPPLVLPPDLPGADRLMAVIKGCISVLPEQRPSLEDVRAGLQEALELQPEEAELPRAARRPSSSGRRAAEPLRTPEPQPLDTLDGRTLTPRARTGRGVPLGLLGGGALLLAAGAAWLLLRAGPATVEQLPIVVAPQPELSGHSATPEAIKPQVTPPAPTPAPVVSAPAASADPSPASLVPSAAPLAPSKGKPRGKPGPLKRDEVTEW